MSKPFCPTNTDELVECMTREDEELEGRKTKRTQGRWAAHVDAVAAAVTTAKVRKTYRNYLVRFVLFLYNMTCNSSKVDDRSIEGENSNEESEEEGIPKEDFDILHDQLKAAIETVPFPEITGRETPREKELAKLAEERNVENAIFRELEKASPAYRPIDLDRLTPRVFLDHLLKLTKSIEQKEYLKSYGGHQSALMMLFNDCGATRTELFNQEVTKAMKESKNTSSAIFRGALGAHLTEGKDPLPFIVYQKICQWLLEKGDKSSIFAHCFLTLTWNLMCRSINTTLVCRDHMSWEGDAVGIQFAHSKTDITGNQAAYIRHVYANPLNPWICPVLSLSRFLISFPGKRDTGPLFEGSSQYDRFRANLQKIVMEHAEEILAMGVEPENIGVHSIRKGAATYCTSGTTTGVSFAALCFRAGWSMGGVKDQYIKYAEAGDRVCGRTVAGLDVTSHEFSVSPPLIDASSEEDEGDILDANGILFGPTGAKWGLLPRFILASLLFHRDWMLSNVGSDFIHHCRFYDASTASETLYVRLAAKAKICYPWTMKSEVSTGNHFPITGLPQAVIDFNYHQEQLMILRKLPEIIIEGVIAKLDERGVVAERDERGTGGGEFSLKQLRDEIRSLLKEELKELNISLSLQSSLAASDNSKVVSPEKSVSSKDFSSQFCSFPESYKIDHKGSCLHVWNNWHFGKYHQAENANGGEYRTPPWKSLKYPQLLQCSSQKGYLLNLKFLCEKLDEAAGINKNSTPTEKQLIEHFTSPAIEALWEGMCATANGRVRRLSQNNWETTARTLRVQLKAREKGEPALKSSAGCKKKRRTPSTPPPPKRARSGANLEDDEVVIVAVDSDSRKTWKKEKGVCRLSMQGAAWEVPGPDKSDEDCGRIRLDVGDRDFLHRQGCNLSGCTTSAFHNLVCNHYYEQNVRCTESEFVPDLSMLIAQNGKYKGWNEYLSMLYFRESGSRNVAWDSAKVILIQVFWGELENGHFASLVIDRTRKGNPLAVYADSLSTFYRSKEYESPIDNLKSILADTPLQLQNEDENWTWIEAEVPRQGFCTNDCGVIASCFALLYVRGLENRGLLTGHEVENVAPVRSVKLRIPPTTTMSAFGILGRRYMSQSMRVARLDFTSSLFDAEVVWNSDI